MTTNTDRWRAKIDWAPWAIAAAGVCVAASVALARFSPVFDIAAQAAAPMFSVVLVVAFVMLLMRRWRPLAGLAAALAALLLALQTQWFSSTPAAAPGASPVRIYFNNIWRGNDHNDRIAASIAEAKPDVVAIAEYSDRQAKDPRALAAFPYRVASKPDCVFEGCPRQLIASRWPVDDVKGYGRGRSYAVTAARIRAPQGAFRLVDIHMTRPWPFKHAGALPYQVRDLARAIAAQPREPIVLVGDFNATLSGALLKDLSATTGLTPVPERLGDWPSLAPAPLRVAIENAFAGEGETIISRRLGKPNGSDHVPIVIEVAAAAR
jgi:endonuclease/exonuclease/phosphatase (EEP) superfamily protein YafD